MHMDIRTAIRLVEQATAPVFTDHLIDAVSAAEAGFHFEEGGCFGMALALADAFRADGLDPELVLMRGATHAMVRVDGALYDHQGRVPVSPVVRVVTEFELRQAAAMAGWKRRRG